MRENMPPWAYQTLSKRASRVEKYEEWKEAYLEELLDGYNFIKTECPEMDFDAYCEEQYELELEEQHGA